VNTLTVPMPAGRALALGDTLTDVPDRLQQPVIDRQLRMALVFPTHTSGGKGFCVRQVYHRSMSSPLDLAQIRFDNALALFDEFVRNTIKHPDAATLRGLEGRFAERVQIQPSYWSQIKGRSRQIGERLARQFEQLCHKPQGWMDQVHTSFTTATKPDAMVESASESHDPQDDDERFIVGLVLTYYRRHPQRARTRLLDLLGEVLTPPASDAKQKATPSQKPAGTAAKAPSATTDTHALWLRSQVGVAPLRQKK
jgi:hypothetical protein